MIRFATGDMLPDLKALWAACFGDDPAYIDYLFEHLLRPEHVLVHLDDRGLPAAMLCLEPFLLATPEGNADGAYLFGVATAPEQQGKGLSTALLAECHRRLQGDGFALSALVPAGESLFRFYGKRGYETAFDIAVADLAAAELPEGAPGRAEPASFGTLADFRSRFYADRARFVRWQPDYLSYIGGECGLLGGEVLALTVGGEAGYAVCYPSEDGGAVTVKELAVGDEHLPGALQTLHSRYGAGRYRVYLPADTPGYANKVLPFAMVRWYDKMIQKRTSAARGRAGWIAHVLD